MILAQNALDITYTLWKTITLDRIAIILPSQTIIASVKTEEDDTASFPPERLEVVAAASPPSALRAWQYVGKVAPLQAKIVFPRLPHG